MQLPVSKLPTCLPDELLRYAYHSCLTCLQAVPLECVPQAEVQQLVDEAVATAHAQHRAADLRAQAEAEEQQRRFAEALQARDR